MINGIALRRKLSQHAGFTLIELMVSIVIGLIILSAVVGLFTSMIKSDSDNLKSIRLHQELRSVMSLITRDIRRAGVNQNAAANSVTTPPTNPFSVSGITRLTISPYLTKPGASITFSYDVDPDPAACTAENFGYRWDSVNLTIESFSGSSVAGCSNNPGAWSVITDNDLIEITDDGAVGSTAGSPRGLVFAKSTVVEDGVNINEVTVTLWGRLKKDRSVMHTLSETIKIRNDEF